MLSSFSNLSLTYSFLSGQLLSPTRLKSFIFTLDFSSFFFFYNPSIWTNPFGIRPTNLRGGRPSLRLAYQINMESNLFPLMVQTFQGAILPGTQTWIFQRIVPRRYRTWMLWYSIQLYHWMFYHCAMPTGTEFVLLECVSDRSTNNIFSVNWDSKIDQFTFVGKWCSTKFELLNHLRTKNEIEGANKKITSHKGKTHIEKSNWKLY